MYYSPLLEFQGSNSDNQGHRSLDLAVLPTLPFGNLFKKGLDLADYRILDIGIINKSNSDAHCSGVKVVFVFVFLIYFIVESCYITQPGLEKICKEQRLEGVMEISKSGKRKQTNKNPKNQIPRRIFRGCISWVLDKVYFVEHHCTAILLLRSVDEKL